MENILESHQDWENVSIFSLSHIHKERERVRSKQFQYNNNYIKMDINTNHCDKQEKLLSITEQIASL